MRQEKRKTPRKGAKSMKLEYIQNGDYLIPNLKANEEPEGMLTKYGLMRKNYLKEHRRGIYGAMLLEGTLREHLLTVQEQAENRLDFLMGQMAEREGVDERLKAAEQLTWVSRMNSIKARAEESVLAEIVFS